MARFYPKQPPIGSPSSELKIRRAFSLLSDDWTVLHSVWWQGIRSSRQSDGEADFVLAHESFGAIVLEVKGGRVGVDNGVWYTIGRDDIRSDIKNPFLQAKDSKYRLLEFFKQVRPSMSAVPVCHGVVVPDVFYGDDIAMYGPRAIVIDTTDLADPSASLGRMLAHWKQARPIGARIVERIVRLLEPTVELQVRVSDEVHRAEAEVRSLTERQCAALRQLGRNRIACILGSAGTGKTVLALERCRMSANAGARVLFTCFNAPLADYVETQAPETVQVQTFHSFVRSRARAEGIHIPGSKADEWWEFEAVDLLRTCRGSPDEAFDAIVVDEGQDFAPSWLEGLQCYMADEALFYVFADSHQELYTRGFKLPEGAVVFELTENCRNPAEVASKVARVLGDEPGTVSMKWGPTPIFVECCVEVDGHSIVASMVGRFIEDEGLAATEVVVISNSRRIVDELQLMTIGAQIFTRYGKEGVVVETIHRFKGLEAAVVILVLTDDILSGPVRGKHLSYVGLSRCTGMLCVLGSRGVRHFLRWDEA